MMTEIPLLRSEWLDLPIEEPTVADVLRILNKSAKTADAKGESKVGDWRRGQAGRIGVYRADYLKLLGIDGDYEPKAGELIGHLRGNKERYDKSVYSPALQGDIDVLVNVLLLYHVVNYMSEDRVDDTPEVRQIAKRINQQIDNVEEAQEGERKIGWRSRYAESRYKDEEKSLALEMRDPLTGLKNRRAFTDSLTGEVDRAIRIQAKAKTKLPLVVVMMDLVNFKRVNDAHGQKAGDLLLRKIAERLDGGLRKGDEKGRWGGDEFVLILPGTSLETATEVMGKLQSNIRKPINLPKAKAVEMDSRFGLAEFPADLVIPEPEKLTGKIIENLAGQLIDRADVVLTEAKKEKTEGKIVTWSEKSEQ